MNILDFIPYGRENAVSRSFLVSLTGLPDRSIREAIQATNESGTAIICCEAGTGYFRPKTVAEAERYINYSRSYLISLAKKDRAMRKAVKHLFSGQISYDL